MPKTSLPIDAEKDDELAELMGGDFEALNISAEERIIAGLLASVRGQIVAAMSADSIGVRQLSRRLGISGAAVSRHLNAEGDMRFSTAALLAHALQRHWEINLLSNQATIPRTSNSYRNAYSHYETDLKVPPTVSATVTGSTGAEKRIEHDRPSEVFGLVTY